MTGLSAYYRNNPSFCTARPSIHSPFPDVEELEPLLGDDQILEAGEPHEGLARGRQWASLAGLDRFFHSLPSKETRSRCKGRKEGGRDGSLSFINMTGSRSSRREPLLRVRSTTPGLHEP